MSVTISPPMFLQFMNPNNTGAPAAGLQLFTYLAGTSTKQSTWTDSTQTTQNSNPIPLDALGGANVWGDPTLAYKFVWAPANDTDPPTSPIRTVDNLYFPLSLAALTQNVLGLILYPRTAQEIAASVTPTNFYIPSHPITGEIYPQRYGAKFDGATNDTTALQNTFNVALQAGCQVVMPNGTAIVGSAGGGFALTWGSNSAVGASTHPPGLRGQGISTTLKAAAGFTGTVVGARGIAAQFMRDFVIDGNSTATVCIDTSWPATVGTTTNNVYENIWVQNFATNGWLAINDNQAKWTSITARGAASFGLSGLRIEGSGGSFSLDNVQVADSFLSITCQNCDIRGGFFRGVRINESTSGVNYLYLSSCQIFANPTTLSHFTDANPTIHYATSVVLDGCYLLASSGTAQTTTVDCGVAAKWIFNECAFIFGSSTGVWNLYSPNAHAQITPVFVKFDGCTMTDGVHSVFINTVAGFITEREDAVAGPANVLSDYPMRVVYRAVIPFASGLLVNTFTNIIPPSAMTDNGASYIICVHVSASGADNLGCAAFVAAETRTGGGPSGAIAVGSTANIANNLTNVISLRYSATVSNEAGIDAAINIALANGSSISVTLIRLANPTVNY